METILLTILAGLCIFAVILNLKEDVQQKTVPLPSRGCDSIHNLDDITLMDFIRTHKYKTDLYYQYAVMEAGRRGLL